MSSPGSGELDPGAPGPAAPGPAGPGSGAPGTPAPGSKAWVEARFGRQASFGERVLPRLVDDLLALAVTIPPCAVGTALLLAGGADEDASLPLVLGGTAVLVLSLLAGLTFTIWNRVLRVAGTGQSIGRRLGGLVVVDVRTGEPPGVGRAALRELVASLASLVSALWLLLDDDERTLGDRVGGQAVLTTPSRSRDTT